MKPKRVKVRWESRTIYTAFYICPFCKTGHHDHMLYKEVTRFKCSHCNKELIATHIKEIEQKNEGTI